MKVYILRTYPRKWFVPVAWAIKTFQGRPYDHYAIHVVNGISDFVFDATGKDTRIQDPKDFFSRYKTIFSDQVHCIGTFNDVLAWAISHSGKGYGFGQIFGLLLKILGLKDHNDFGEGRKKIICNELVLMFFERFSGFKSGKNLDEYDLIETEGPLNMVKVKL